MHVEQTVDLLEYIGQLGIAVAHKLRIAAEGFGDGLKAFQEGSRIRFNAVIAPVSVSGILEPLRLIQC